MRFRFVIQKHKARTVHYDFRLEKDGVLKSWAVPKGIPKQQGVRRLAVQTEDHAIEFADFEGEIPIGTYGAGVIEIWDRGTYQLHQWSKEQIVFTLYGKRLKGTYNLILFPRGGSRKWLVSKVRDNIEDPNG